MAARMNRRIFGMLSKRLDELGLDEIEDARDDRGKRWRLGTLLRATLGAMVAGAKSLAKVEDLTEPTTFCAGSLTPCSRSSAPSLSARTSAVQRHGRRSWQTYLSP